jgi:TBC1 domain family protein 5
MPDNTYFRQPDTQKRLLDILFVWCKLNPDVGYRQGMHELLAPMVWVVEKDVIETAGITLDPSKLKDDDRLLVSILDGRFIEHDAFTLFSRIMQTGKSFYEPAVQENRSARNTKGPAAERDSPMILRSQHIFKDLLPAVDPELADHLEKIDIMPQIFLM